MPSSDTKRTKIDVGWAVVAWAQFLVIVTAVDKRDFHLLGQFVRQFVSSPELLKQDPRPFGSVALLLNAVALSVTVLPLLPLRKNAHKSLVRAFEFHGQLFAGLGALCWIFSFLAFLFYLDGTIAIATIVAFFVSLIWIAIAIRIAQKT